MLKGLKKFLNPVQLNGDLSFIKIIKSMYSVATFFGLVPYNVKLEKTKCELTIIPKSIYINTLYGVSTVLTVYIFLALHIQEVFLSSDNNSMIDALLTQVNYIIELTILIIFITVTYVCTFLNRRKYVKILNLLVLIWTEQPKTNKSFIIMKHLYNKIQVYVKGGLFLIVILQICVNFTRNDSVWKMILVSMSFNLPQTVQLILIAFYYTIVMALIALLTNLNEHMLRLRKNKINVYSGTVDVKQLQSLTLRQIELIYTKVFEAKTNINEAFQGPLLVTTLQCFHAIISEAHIIYHGLIIKRCFSLHETFNCAIWIMYQLIKIFALAYSGNALKSSVAKIGQTLFDIPTERQDVRWFMEIQHFSALISHQNIEMNLYGCFPLDSTFLYNILGSATMYLIILVQFDKKE